MVAQSVNVVAQDLLEKSIHSFVFYKFLFPHNNLNKVQRGLLGVSCTPDYQHPVGSRGGASSPQEE